MFSHDREDIERRQASGLARFFHAKFGAKAIAALAPCIQAFRICRWQRYENDGHARPQFTAPLGEH